MAFGGGVGGVGGVGGLGGAPGFGGGFSGAPNPGAPGHIGPGPSSLGGLAGPGFGGVGLGGMGLGGDPAGLAGQAAASMAAANAAQGQLGNQDASLASALSGKKAATTQSPSQLSKTAAALGPTKTSRLSAPAAPSPVNTAAQSMAAINAAKPARPASTPPAPEPATPHIAASVLAKELGVKDRNNLAAARPQMEAMAHVMKNRMEKQSPFAAPNMKAVLTQDKQFSPLNTRKSQIETLSTLPAQNPALYSSALQTYNDVMADRVEDPTLDADHYANLAISDPAWADPTKKTVDIGPHSFFNLDPQKFSPQPAPNMPVPAQRPDVALAAAPRATPPAPEQNPGFATAAMRALAPAQPAPPAPSQRPALAAPAPPAPARRPRDDEQTTPSLPGRRPSYASALAAAPPAPSQRPGPAAPSLPGRRPSYASTTPPAPDMTAAQAFQSNLAEFGKMMAPTTSALDQQAQSEFDAAVSAVTQPEDEGQAFGPGSYSFSPNEAIASVAAPEQQEQQGPAVASIDPSLRDVVNPPAVAQALAPPPTQTAQQQGPRSYSFNPNQAVVAASRPQDAEQQDSLTAALTAAPPAPVANPNFRPSATEQQAAPSVPGIAVSAPAQQQMAAAAPAPSQRPAPAAPPAPSRRPAPAQPAEEQSFAERMAELEAQRQRNIEQAEEEYAQESKENVPAIQRTLDEASDQVAGLVGPMSEYAQSRALSRSLLGGSEGGQGPLPSGDEEDEDRGRGRGGRRGGGTPADIYYRSVEGDLIPMSRQQRATYTGNYAFNPRDAQIAYRNINGTMVPMTSTEAAFYDQNH